MAHQWREVDIASGFIAAFKQLPIDGAQQAGDKTMAEWIAWAEQQLVSRSPSQQGCRADLGLSIQGNCLDLQRSIINGILRAIAPNGHFHSQ
ncbi:MAG: hypothetical protein DI582_08220 [Azospirillum brasilense]|nr:MAG: hypothetical protein DI582_08220 [Azospirillum brasilense]